MALKYLKMIEEMWHGANNVALGYQTLKDVTSGINNVGMRTSSGVNNLIMLYTQDDYC